MNRLSKAQLIKRQEITSALNEEHEKVVAAIENYNAVLEDARDLRDEILEAANDYVANRSEKWQEGDRASAYQDFISEWESAEIEPLEVPEMNPDALDGLPDEVSS